MAKNRALREDGTPVRLSIEPHSPFFWAGISCHIGVRVNEVERNDIREYCSEGGWVTTAKGHEPGVKVEPYWRIQPSRQIRRQLKRLTSG